MSGGLERARRHLAAAVAELEAACACEMVFSGEDAGWQVWFEGDTAGHDTDALVSQVAQQV